MNVIQIETVINWKNLLEKIYKNSEFLPKEWNMKLIEMSNLIFLCKYEVCIYNLNRFKNSPSNNEKKVDKK